MESATGAAFHFADFKGLASLRREAAADGPEARRAVAQQFEALFLNLVLRQMRQAGAVEGGVIDGQRMRLQESLHDQQLALNLARGRGIGLAEALLRQFGDADQPVRPERTAAMLFVQRRAAPPVGLADAPPVTPAEPARPWGSPAEFMRGIWPHARRAAQDLGVDPKVLVAQAALETGWGQHLISARDGRPSHNLFGIKAGTSWEGSRTTVSTLEFIDGVAERRREPFRVYAGPEESFRDYVALVKGSPRYRAALAAGDAEGYLRGLQAGGYATDPEYADKILAILRRGLPIPVQDSAPPADSRHAGDLRARGPGGGEL